MGIKDILQAVWMVELLNMRPTTYDLELQIDTEKYSEGLEILTSDVEYFNSMYDRREVSVACMP